MKKERKESDTINGFSEELYRTMEFLHAQSKIKKDQNKGHVKQVFLDLKDHLKMVEQRKVVIKLSALPPVKEMDLTMLENESEDFPDELNYLMRKSRNPLQGLTLEEKARAYFLVNTLPGTRKKKIYHYGKKKTSAR